MGRSHLAIAAVGLVTTAVFLPVVGHGFINWDDDRNVYENPRLDPVTASGLASFWHEPTFHIYMPVTQTAWAAVASRTRRSEAQTPMERFDPRPFHAMNVLLHAVNAILVVLLLQRFGLVLGAACMGALFFALHPVQVEPVAWVTGLKDVLSGTWALAAMLLYVAFAAADPRRQRPEPEPGSEVHDTRRIVHYVLATIAFVLAMLSKPTTLVLPLLVALVDRGILGRRMRAVLRSTAPWFILSLACLVVNATFQPPPSTSVSPVARIWVALDALGFDLGRLFAPLRLGIDYGRTPKALLEQPWHRLAPWLALGLAALLLAVRRRARAWILAAAIFAAALVPVLGFVPFGYQDISTVADRYLYLAMLGPALAFGLLWTKCTHRAAKVALFAVILGLGVATYFQERIWKSPTRLFEHALRVNSRSRVAHFNLGVVCAADGRVTEAERHFETLLEWNPRDDEAENSLGMALVQIGRLEDGLVHFRRAVEIQPGNIAGRINLAGTLVRCERLHEAEVEYESILRIEPDHLAAHYDLANLLAAQGRVDEAIPHYEAALRIEPGFEAARRKLEAARLLQHSP
jgi:protein O-mannosyl-transferase